MRVEICGDMEVPCFLIVRNVVSSIVVTNNYSLSHMAGLIGLVGVNTASRNESHDLICYNVMMNKKVGVNGFAANVRETPCRENGNVSEESVENGFLTYCCSCDDLSDVCESTSLASDLSFGYLTVLMALLAGSIVSAAVPVPYRPLLSVSCFAEDCSHC